MNIVEKKNLIKNLNYTQLLCLADSNKFYVLIDSPEMLYCYLECLHNSWCNNNNVKPTKIVIDENLNANSWAALSLETKPPTIEFCKDLFDILENCKLTNNKIYPFKIISSCIHESKHLWQFQNHKYLGTSKLSMVENLSVASYASRIKSVEKINNQIRIYNKNERMGKSYGQVISSIYIAILGQEYMMEYGNMPHELDANEEAFKAIKTVYDISNSPQSLLSLVILAKNVKRNFDGGLWFLDNEYLKMKQNGKKDTKFYKALQQCYGDFTSKRYEHYINNRDFSYDIEDYTIECYPMLSDMFSILENTKTDVNKNNGFFNEYTKFLNIYENVCKSKNNNGLIKK